MSAPLINFESAQEKEEQRQWERQARQSVLAKAQQEFETRQQKEEAARQRGEHTWMLPSVEAKLTQDHDAPKKKKKDKKKKEKKKKKKKEKKAKKSKRKECSSSSSSSESEEEEEAKGSKDMWVERSTSSSSVAPLKAPNPQPQPPFKAPTPQPQIKAPTPEPQIKVPSPQPQIKGPQIPPEESTARETVKRDEWMEMTSLFGTFSREQMRDRDGTSRKKAKEEEERKKRAAAKPGSHALELNPYYKNGGTGLPEEQQKAAPAPAPASPHTTGLDAAWLRRALQRAKEQASAEKTSLEEIAAQRWGSLARFNELLADAEGRGKPRENDPRNQQDRRRERRSSRSRERDSMRYKRKSRSRERDGNKSRSESQERERSIGVRKERNRSRSRERRNRSRSRERRDRSKERGSRRHQGSRSSSSSSSSSSRDSSRGSSRNRSKQGSRKEDYHSRENSSKLSHKLLKPSEEPSKGSALSLKFQKPGEEDNRRSASQSTLRGPSGSSSSSSYRWQKKGYQQPVVRKEQRDRRRTPSPSSSSSSSSSSEEEAISEPARPTTTTAGQSEAPDTPAPAPAQLPAPAPPTPLTDKEMNELAAKIMKAELVGNDDQAAKLKKRLDAAREVRAAGGRAGPGEASGTREEEVVVLTRTDSRGVSRPVLGAEAGPGKRRAKVKTHGQDGQRARYFPDDDQHNLKNMFEKEKGTTAEDQNSMFEEAAMKNSERLNDEYDIDDMFMSKAALRDNAAKQAEKDKKKAIQEHQRAERSLESCHWCFDNKEMPKHLIVALGTKCYVSLPSHQSLTPGHCCISPIHHISCCVQAEEDLWDEVQNFRKSLVKMFASRGEDCIFFETVKRLRHFPHMVLQCVPLPRETGDMAPIYFKKAIMECEREWAQNKKLVELKGRDVRRGVPKGLPYFFVDFAMDAGFAHVIEDEQDFPNNFAQEIVGGMLDLDCNLWRKPRRENFDTQRRKVMEFSRWYKEFDPTQEG